jgi:membrane dipeptidase
VLCDRERNLDDAQIQAIAAAGGMVGVVFLGRFVAAENPSLQDILRHIDHIALMGGVDRVGIGPDYLEGAEDMIIASRRVGGAHQPVNDTTIPFAAGLEHPGKLPALTQALLARGYGEAEIRGILGMNFLRFFRQVRHGA